MASRPSGLEPAFIESQRQRLLAERVRLMSAVESEDDEVGLVASTDSGQANETEDMAQDLTIAENDRVLSGTLAGHQRQIERALAKIDEGTYGLSDESGNPIGLSRLQAYPEAIFTLEEEQALQRARPRAAM